MHYFAYGSNLNKADLDRFCRAHDYRTDLLQPLTVAYLPDMSLAFNYYSHSRFGGVLNVVDHCGQYVVGVIFTVAAEAWPILDHKEGAPFCYQRCSRIALTDDGQELPVIVYEVRPKRREIFVPPALDYLNVVSAGLSHYQLDTDALYAAANNDLDYSQIDLLFLSERLLTDEIYHSVITPEIIDSLQPAQISVTENNSIKSPRISGELLRVRELSLILPELDRINGFLGFGAHDSYARRALINVDIGNGHQQKSWSYIY